MFVKRCTTNTIETKANWPKMLHSPAPQTQHIFSMGISSLKRCKSDREAILTKARKQSLRSDPVDLEGILWFPILLLL